MNDELLKQLQEMRERARLERDFSPAKFLAERIKAGALKIPAADSASFASQFVHLWRYGAYAAPEIVLETSALLLGGRRAGVACDPWADLGVLARRVRDVTGAKTYAVSMNVEDATLGKALAPELEWITGDFLKVIDALPAAIDVIASVLPFSARTQGPRTFDGASGTPVDVADDRASQILAAASLRLSPDGVALYVVAPSFFRSDSILHKLGQLGLGLDAAFALPAGTFAPYTNVAAYLIVVRRVASDTMFVAQLSKDSHTNAQVVENFRQHRADGPFELGRYVSPGSFRGLEPLRLEERLRGAETRFGVRSVSLGEIASDIRLGRPQADFDFPVISNALFVPLIGNSDVVDDPESLILKKQNYAQIAIDPARSDARFVARFLNSELGRSIREAHKSGTTIPKLNSTGLRQLRLFVPNHKSQREILAIDQRVGVEHTTLLGLQNDLASVERDLWSPSVDMPDIERRLGALSSRMSGVAPHVASTLDQWFETLPFPLASILRTWQATASDDYRAKYEHLLQFFEAAAEFISVIYLSAFGSQSSFFEPHRAKLVDAWAKQRVSLERPTFATWRIANEYLSKQTRQLMDDDAEGRPLCGELFADPSLTLPRMLAHKDIATVFAAANKMRNDWSGHGGAVSPEDAGQRNQLLLGELQKLREAMADDWKSVKLARALHCKPRGGIFENEIALLVGSNTEFLKQPRAMATWLDIERLYLLSDGAAHGLQLLPLVFIGASPPSAKNACYFFNRVEKDGVRFVSYHFADKAELTELFAEASAAISSLAQAGSAAGT